MFHVEHAKNQESAKTEFCGFFLCDLTKNYFWRGGASSKSTIVFVWASKTCDRLHEFSHSLYFGAPAPVVK